MNKYYVYLHVDPRDDRIKYVGMGQGSRAWIIGKVKSLRNASLSFKKIAEQLGVSVMTAWRMSHAG